MSRPFEGFRVGAPERGEVGFLAKLPGLLPVGVLLPSFMVFLVWLAAELPPLVNDAPLDCVRLSLIPSPNSDTTSFTISSLDAFLPAVARASPRGALRPRPGRSP
mmetsp:Transcript_33367/g.103581  ORF Transcript_33367/g.103581 Transcript_33367/m.103581 type:complete len:105 (+) Transcript_33367:115-429(+)